ncbi:hypothetical protein LTR10_009236 [Elasticomyces elasticus]|nr:hypothetical protein LTR10_009236 [Elasticomyces elasticus]KAK4971664.1 hypothetical protein LTR42_007392 [Elasticomyces elasticus]
MDALGTSWEGAHTYPSNLCIADASSAVLDGIRHELVRQEDVLFCEAASASVAILELYNPNQGFKSACVRDADQLDKTLHVPLFQGRPDPICRFLFIYAPTSRDPLNITLVMAQQIFTYHQVMSSFMDCVFSFGFREHSQDCSLAAFYSSNRLSEPYLGLQITELGRSGRMMEHCYSLKSVERSNGQLDWPWAVRQCSIYHALDLKSAQATWIVIKANRLMEKLVADATAPPQYQAKLTPRSVGTAVAAALVVHELVVAWSSDNWHWYISFLESALQDITRPTLAATMEPERPVRAVRQFPDMPFVDSPAQSTFETPIFEKQMSWKRATSTLKTLVPRRLTTRMSHRTPALDDDDRTVTVSRHHFTFKDLPRVHYIEERANEILGILQNNDEVVGSLIADYETVVATLDRSDGDGLDIAMGQFRISVNASQKKMRLQQARVGKLLRLLADRRTLLQGILSYESMQANRRLAEKASISADNMEMLAQKTKLEAVSMRIITLVTLFFLPGTFISTLMSTPIVTFAPGSSSTSDSNISTGALGFYVAISLPLMILTFLSWYAVYWWENRKEKNRLHRLPLTEDV